METGNDAGRHVVLGGAGAVGHAVIDELNRRGIKPVAVERAHPVAGAEMHAADMLDPNETFDVLRCATHIYLCIGLAYRTDVWVHDWPRIMRNVSVAAEREGARVIFFDNIYCYGPAPLHNPITENHEQKPVSKKGQVRKEVADRLMNAHAEGKIRALIARSADFYGPGAKNSLLQHLMLDRMHQGKAPVWPGDPDRPHSFTFVPDAGRAMVELALDEEAYGQVWHLPTDAPPWTPSNIGAELGRLVGGPKIVTRPPKILAPLIPALRELGEVGYQFEHPYMFSDEKFRMRYPNFSVMSMRDGLHATVMAGQRTTSVMLH
jgi:nucleoside-diphosphate-sugar epimerase